MRIRQLGIHNVLHFDRFQLNFGEDEAGLHIVYGPNEAGKSTILRVLVDLLFGGKINDEFKDSYGSKSFIEGILEASRNGAAGEVAAGEMGQGEVAAIDGTAGKLAAGTGSSVSSSDVSVTQLAIARKRRYNRLVLTDETQSELSEDIMLPLLGGLDKERYTLLFGFNHERLRQGGDSLLESGGHAGISLFEAGGGIQFLQAVLVSLTDRADATLDVSFRTNSKKHLNTAWRLYKELRDHGRKASLRGEDWHRLKNEIETKEDKIVTLTKELKELKERRSQLQRIGRIRHFVVDLKEVRHRLDEMADAEELTFALDEQILSDMSRLEEVEEKLRGIEQNRSLEEQALQQITVRPSILAATEQIEALYQSVEKYLEAKDAIPVLSEKIARHESEARDLAKDLAPAVSFADVELVRVPLSDDLEIRRLALSSKELQRDEKQAKAQLLEIDEEAKRRKDELLQLGDKVDVEGLRQVLDEVQRAGDVESMLQQLRRDIATRRQGSFTQLQSQAIWNGQLDDLKNLPVPLMETVSRYVDKFAEIEQKMIGYQRDIAKGTEQLETLSEQIADFERTGRVPIEADLENARRHRDRGWNLIRRFWFDEERLEDGADDLLRGSAEDSLEDEVRGYAGGKPLPDAFEEAVAEADHISDWMRRESDKSAVRSNYLLQQERTENMMAKLSNALNEAKSEYDALKNEWGEEWRNTGIHPRSPLEMKGWFTDFYRPLLKELREIQVLESRVEEQVRLRTTLVTRLSVAFKEARGGLRVSDDDPRVLSADRPLHPDEETFDSLHDLVSTASHFIHESDARDTLRQTLSKQYDDLMNKRSLEAGRKQQVQGQLGDMSTRWGEFTARYPFLPKDPLVVTDYLDKLRDLFDMVTEFARLGQERDKQVTVCESFERDVEKLADDVGETLDKEALYHAFVRRMFRELREAREQDTARRMTLQRIGKLRTDFERLFAARAALIDVINSYKDKYHCVDDEALRMLIAKSKEKKELRRQVEQISTGLRHAGDGLGTDDLVTQVENGPAVDALPLIEQEVTTTIEQQEEALSAEQKTLWQLNQQFADMNAEKSDTADYVQQAEFQLAEVDRYWNQYLRLELARRLLQRAIEEFREQNESTVIERAGVLFRRLTLGRYQELTVEYDGVEPVLEAITRDNERRRVLQMSDGTRDQLYLALRVAFVEQHIDSGDAVPLIMDDILVHFDDARTIATLEVLSELGKKTQILYFTHHQSIADAAATLMQSGTAGITVHRLDGPENSSVDAI